ncbi:MAG: hypothetical protein H6548_05000 [Chitinophagales bacterium]|nr:hypothetical protein [Chitinophagales bacterium]HAE14140.1 hypothetical protein [Bacteroidota bacterium]MCB9021457.1 hypothetical protein [Chitinophagales bacterium]MCB9032026.1 hypothetical protein [Chitinophagales bacterium]HAE34437.1 hypothetical protein [Bacteroidota bacterium]
MIKTLTQDHLIRFMYGETGPEETGLIRESLLTDTDLHDQFEQLRDAARGLDTVMASPPEYTVKRILRYSKSTAPTEHMM